MDLVCDYKDDERLRLSFNQLAKDVFGISFEEWYQKGLWDDSYVCHSYKQADRIVANVSVTKMTLVTQGKERKLLQIGTVMTHPDYRGKGLAKRLMENVSARYQDEYQTSFLFANKSVLGFYPKFGYKRVQRRQLFTRDISPAKSSYRFRKLDVDRPDDLAALVRITKKRVPTSSRLSFFGSEGILYWYCLGPFRNSIYLDEDSGIVLIYAIDGDILNVYDIISQQEGISYREILESISQEGVEEMVFHFELEANDLGVQTRAFDDVKEDDVMFVKGDLGVDTIVYPITYHT